MISATAIAWSQSRYGAPDVLTQTPLPARAPGPDEVLVEVEACALNSADVRIMRGDPLLIRLAFGLRRPRTAVPGRDVAGRVAAAGSAVTSWAVGDRVVGEIGGGGLGATVVASAAKFVAIPEGLSSEVAAALPLAGGTAWQALDLGGVERGSRVLVVGAGGGVGTFAVRLAVLRGARVDALCGERAKDVVASLGAERVDDYRTTDLADRRGADYDAVIDIGGSVPLRTLQQVVRDGGLVVGVSGGANRVFGPLGRMLRAAVLSIGSSRRIRSLAAVAKPDLTAALVDLAARGDLVPPIERTWQIDRGREAMAYMDAGHAVGKVIVRH